MATKKTNETEGTEEVKTTEEAPKITMTVDELKKLVAEEVSKAVKAAGSSVTKEDLKGLIDPLGRNYASTAKVCVAKGGKVVKQD